MRLTRVRPASDGILEIPLETCSNLGPVHRVLRALVVITVIAGLACAAAPASSRTPAIPAGVSISGVHVGGLSSEPARARVEAAFQRPVRVVYHGRTTVLTPKTLGTALSVDKAVSAALSATPSSEIALPVHASRAKVEHAVQTLARRYDRRAVDAAVVGANEEGPEFSASQTGLAVDTRTMARAITQVLRDGTRAPLTLLTRPVQPARTVAGYGPVIVITRSTNTLRLYDGPSLVRTFSVATGQAIYPTPAGLWQIMDMQRDPWWYPPVQDEWAKGLKPVPPGPSNPLGTRWMGLNAPGVGIHGTDAPTSIGYSASHGCIRMQVPDAEWLFEQVHVGTPVVIL
jgi:lipoprotein-anchoring transpeptidase ErfK/SrfK